MAAFSSPPNLKDFHARVWDIVRRVPPGRVTAYGRIAQMIPPPGGMDAKSYLAFGARWVGGAMAQCPADVPWWRVINAKGEISLRPGAQEQRARLEAEGVEFDDRGRVDLKHFGWDDVEGGPEQPKLF
ncbi:MAG: methyltransferase [Chloroflexi bacterium]|nr:methyltransferase [Chloroflexota bacterium]